MYLLIGDCGVDDEEKCHICHCNELQTDARHEGALASCETCKLLRLYGREADTVRHTNEVDQEKGTKHGRAELDETEDAGGEELLVLSGDTHESEVLGSVLETVSYCFIAR